MRDSWEEGQMGGGRVRESEREGERDGRRKRDGRRER